MLLQAAAVTFFISASICSYLILTGTPGRTSKMFLLSCACNITQWTALRRGFSQNERLRILDIFGLVRNFQSSVSLSGRKTTFKTILNDPEAKIPPRISVSEADLYCDPSEKLQKLVEVRVFVRLLSPI